MLEKALALRPRRQAAVAHGAVVLYDNNYGESKFQVGVVVYTVTFAEDAIAGKEVCQRVQQWVLVVVALLFIGSAGPIMCFALLRLQCMRFLFSCLDFSTEMSNKIWLWSYSAVPVFGNPRMLLSSFS